MNNDVPEVQPDHAGNNGHHRTTNMETKVMSRYHKKDNEQPTKNQKQLHKTYLKIPSGSKGAWHHEGASEGSGP